MTQIQTLSTADLEILKNAKNNMDNIGWAMKGLNKVGNIIESRIELLPAKQQQWLQQLSYKVLHGVVKSNLVSMKSGKLKTTPLNKTYATVVASSGILGGALGASAFAADLAVSTKFMMRSIMDIARNEGEDLENFDTQLACLQVFALGGKSKHDNSLETGYYGSRVAINASVKGGVKALDGLVKGSTNPLLQLVSVIASRFSLQVSEKFVAQAIPVVGAVGGASINLAFMQHFQRMAKAHFAIRRLERIYGAALVETSYESI